MELVYDIKILCLIFDVIDLFRRWENLLIYLKMWGDLIKLSQLDHGYIISPIQIQKLTLWEPN